MKSVHFTVLIAVITLASFSNEVTAQSALQFNGTSQYISAGQAPGLNTQTFTLECWFNRTATGTAASTGSTGITTMVPLISKGAAESETAGLNANYILGINTATNTLAADFEESTGPNHPAFVPTSPASNVIANGTWYHAAVTFDGSVPGDKTWRFYLNGTLVHTEAEAASPDPASGQHFAIGSMVPSTGVAAGFFAGIIDEVRVWNVVRTQAEISGNMSVAMTSATGLVGRWGLNEGTGFQVALDTAGTTGEAGSLIPSTFTTWVAGAPGLSASGEVIRSFQQGVGGYASAVDVMLSALEAGSPPAVITALTVDGETTPGTTTEARHALLRYDNIFGAGGTQIPSGATILGAGLSLNVTNATANATNVHRMLQSWSASSTWNGFVGGVQANGTEAASAADVAIPISSVFNFTAIPGIRTADVTNSIRSWQSTTNNGWAWLPTGTDGLVFDSSDAATAANRPKLVVAYAGSVNLPPDAPTVVTPLNGANGVSTSPTLTVNVTDPESEPMTVTFFGRESNAEMEDFTIVVLPDTQLYAQSRPALYAAQLEWIRDNRVARNIVFVTQLGDCVNNQDDAGQEFQWTNASAAWDLIESPNAEIPYGIAVGNHDNGGNARSGANEGATTIQWTKHFGLQRYCLGTCSNNVSIVCEKDADCVSPGICNPGSSCKSWFGGRYDFGDPVTYFRNTDNHYELFSAGGMDFIAFHLEWDCADGSMGCVSPGVPHATRAATIAWMDNILTNVYPNRRAMISSHHLIQPTGNPPAFSNQGQAVFNAVQDNPNVFMTLCGHLDQANRRRDPATGEPPPGVPKIHSMISDYQTLPEGGRGWMRTMTFSPSTNNIHVETFSPWVNYPATPRVLQSINSHGDNTAGTAQNDFNLDYTMAPSFVQIGLPQTGVASGSNASVVWSGLNTDALHEWYVTVSDGTTTITGPTWTFTTTCSSDAACNDNNPCTDDVCNIGNGTCLNTNDSSNSCTDGTACTVGDACVSGACVPGTLTTCTSPQTCNPSTGLCEMPPQTVTFQQGVSGYTGNVDTYLQADLAHPAHNGTNVALNVDLSPVKHILLRFDNIFGAGAGQIPSGSTISSASLTINVTNESANAGACLHRMLQPWLDTDTYDSRVAGIQANGVEAATTADKCSSSAVAVHTINFTTAGELASLVAWLANPSSNYGWAWLPPATDNSWVFDSAEGATPTLRPKLSVTFVPPLPCTVNSECDDNDVCNGVETCNTGSGFCEDGTPLNCDDSNPCTNDSCLPASGCQHVNNTNSCDDGNACTSSDVCSAATCAGTPISNCCTTVAQCDDGNDCTTDECSTANTAALAFDGTNDYVDLGNAASLTNFGTNSFTIEGWLYTDGGNADRTGVIRFGRQDDNMQIALQLTGAAAPFLALAGSVETDGAGGQADVNLAGTAITPNAWHHFALIADRSTLPGNPAGQQLRLHIDGGAAIVANASAWGTSTASSTDNVVFGASRLGAGGLTTFYDGRLDEVRVWDGVRTLAEIQTNMNAQIVSAPGLRARWGMNEGTGTAAADSVGTNNGTLVGGTVWLTTGLVNLGSNQCVNTLIPGCCEIAADCDDSNECTDDDCVSNACAHTNNTDSCDDNNACTSGDACSGGTCVGTTISCDDGEICTTDSCVPATGCQYANNTLPCNDGDPCTAGDVCGGGSCQAGSPIPNCCDNPADCDDGEICTNDTCTPGNTFSLEFTGPAPTGQVSMGAAPSLNAQEFTLETWFRRTGAGVANTSGTGGIASLVPLFGKGAPEADTPINLNMNYVIGINTAANTLAADFEDSATGLNHSVTAAGPAILADSTWHHAAATYKLDTTPSAVDWKLYLDGALVGSVDVAGSFLPVGNSIQHFGLGTMLTSGGAALGRFQGMLDEVRVWNYARSQAQIQAARFVEIASEAGLIGRWSLNNGTGTSATDSSGGANHGTASGGFAWRSDVVAPIGNQCYYAPITDCCETVADCDDGDDCTTDACIANECDFDPIPGCCVTAAECDDDDLCTLDACVANLCQNTPNAAICDDSNVCTDDLCADAAVSSARCSDGVDDHIVLGNHATIANFGTSSRTIELWVRVDANPTVDLTGVFRGGRQGAFSQVAVQLRTTPTIGIGASVEDVGGGNRQYDTASIAYTLGQWTHVAVVIDRSVNHLRFYVNGALASTVTSGTGGVWTGAISSTDSVVLGAARVTAGTLANFFRGAMDELRIWDHARTATQISQNMNRAIDSAPGLLARWSFDEGGGGTVTDSVGSIVGTLQSGANFDSANVTALTECTNTNNTLPCNDNDGCTTSDTCAGGTCVGGPPSACDDGNDCTDDMCTAGACAHPNSATGTSCGSNSDTQCDDPDTCDGAGACQSNHQPNGTSCSDGLFCNGLDTCSGGSCSMHPGDPCSGGPECADSCNEVTDNCFEAAGTLCTDDGNECTDNECDGAGVCASIDNTDACDDADPCTEDDVCSSGVCTGTVIPSCTECTVPADCDDGNDCTQDNCVLSTCTHAPAASGTACTDDGNVCTDNECNGSGLCVALNNTESCSDGSFCNGLDTCSGGSCSVHAGDPCAGGSECANACNETADNCFDASGTVCTDDGNVCTDNECNGAGLCAVLNNTDPCSDGLFCNGSDTCSGGSCSVHAGDPCTGGSECANACNETADNCFDAAGTACTDDGNVCTDNECNGSGSCVALNNTDPCSDGLFCNGLDTCSGGTCSVHAGDPCTGGLECANACNETADNCFDAAGTACTDDGNVCTDNECNGSGLCAVLNNTDPCSDGLFCNGSDTCSGGSCSVHAGDPCTGGSECANACNETADNCFDASGTACTDDGNVCTDNRCNGTGTCAALNNSVLCDDEDACTTNDVCSAGTCVGGTPPDCDDQNACTTDSCDVDDGCQNHPVPNGTSCDDGIFCNGTNACQAGSCVIASPSCPNACETCDEDANVCDWCILDVDQNGGMGTGDFSFFAGCFGSCYAAQHPCAMANFDEDPNHCAGTGDFAGFAGCFGLTCAQCANCDGMLQRSFVADERQLAIQTLVLRQPSAWDETELLPASAESVILGVPFVVEVWAHQGSLSSPDVSLASVYADLFFDNQFLEVLAVEDNGSFPLFPSATISEKHGVVRAVGGCAALGGGLHQGANWVRVATVHVRSQATGFTTLGLEASDLPFGVAVYSRFGDLPADRLRFVGEKLQILSPRNDFKLDRRSRDADR